MFNFHHILATSAKKFHASPTTKSFLQTQNQSFEGKLSKYFINKGNKLQHINTQQNVNKKKCKNVKRLYDGCLLCNLANALNCGEMMPYCTTFYVTHLA